MGAELTIEEFSVTTPTGHICADCGEELKYNEEVWLLQVMHLQLMGTPPPRQFAYYPVIDEHDARGDFLYEPYFFCFDCWELTYGEHKKEMADEPPVIDDLAVIECTCCGSGIREFEYAGVVTLGEPHPSKRAPNFVRGPYFEPIREPDVLCLYCLMVINNSLIKLWDDISQNGECDDCLQMRCWRGPCACTCHLDHSQEVGEHG